VCANKHTQTHTHTHTLARAHTHTHMPSYIHLANPEMLAGRQVPLNMCTYQHTYMHTCIHAYMHTCIHAYMHTCIHAYMHTCMHTCIHAYMHTCIHAYMHTCIHAYIYPAPLHTHLMIFLKSIFFIFYLSLWQQQHTAHTMDRRWEW